MKIDQERGSPSHRFETRFKKDLFDHAQNPPGKDPVLKAFYQAAFEDCSTTGVLFDIISETNQNRPGITNSHLINLIFRAYQFLKFEEKDLSYRYFTDTKDWTQEFGEVFGNGPKKDLYQKLLTTKSTNTSIFQRYSGPFAIIKHLNPEADVSVMDVGCGGNYGLRGIGIEPFQIPNDDTPDKFLTKSFDKEINFKNRLAVDREDPDNQDVYEWRLACSFYPQELGNLKKIVGFEQRIRQNKKVNFLKTDFLTAEITGKFDAIIFCVMLYQHDEKTREAFFKKAQTLLEPKGAIIVQDFAKQDPQNPQRAEFDTSWFGEKFAHKTLASSSQTNWEFWEVFQWNNGRCQEVIEGKDFRRFQKLQPNLS